MDYNCNMAIIKRSWNQSAVGEKSRSNNISLGNYRLVRNLGPLNKRDNSSGNNKFVTDCSDYTRFKKQVPFHKQRKQNHAK